MRIPMKHAMLHSVRSDRMRRLPGMYASFNDFISQTISLWLTIIKTWKGRMGFTEIGCATCGWSERKCVNLVLIITAHRYAKDTQGFGGVG